MTDLRKMSNEELLQELCNTLQSVGTYRGPRTDAEGKMIMRATGLQVEILSRLDGAAPSEGMKPLSPARSGEPSAPQTRAEQYIGSDQERVFLEKKALGDLAAPQPVSGDAPKVVAREIAEMIANDVCNLTWQRINHFVPLIEAMLRPYFPPASQTPPISEHVLNEIVLAICEIPDRTSPDDFPEAMIVTPEELRFIIRDKFEQAATPASTARTDGWIDPENYVAWCRRSKNTIVTCDSDAPGAFKVYRLAAPGSVPQAPTNPEDVPDLYRLAYMPGVWRCPKCEFVLSKATISMSSASIGTTPEDRQSEQCPNDGEWMVPVTYKESLKQCQDRLIQELERGVSQAEPPKEEKPWSRS